MLNEYLNLVSDNIRRRRESENELGIEHPHENLVPMKKHPKSNDNYVYVLEVQRGGSTLYKIGSANNINAAESRLKTEIVGAKHITFVRIFPDYKYLESCVHANLRPYWVVDDYSTELYACDYLTITDAISECIRHYKQMEQNNELETCPELGRRLGTIRKEPINWGAFMPVGYTWGGAKGLRNDNRHTARFYREHKKNYYLPS